LTLSTPSNASRPAAQVAGRGRPPRSAWLERQARWVFPAPAAITLLVLVVFPILYTVWMSFHSWTGQIQTPPQAIGLANYTQALLHDTRMWHAIWRMLIFGGLGIAFQTILGVGMALLFHREFPGKSVVRTIAILPMVTTPVVIALTWTLILNPTQGAIPYIFFKLGLPQVLWLADPKIVLLTLILVDTWEWTPLIMLITLAGLSALPNEPLEAARIDGASSWQIFWQIILPLLRPAIMVAVLLRGIDAIKTFDIIYAMTQGGPGNASETMNIYVFQQAFNYQQIGYASALLVIFFIIVLLLALVLIRLRRAPSWQP
jgi:multiple sugar transport system permease protein